MIKSNAPISNNKTSIGFSTGAGKKINLSQDKIDQARKRLQVAVETPSASTAGVGSAGSISGFGGFSTGDGTKINISKAAMDRRKNTAVFGRDTSNSRPSSSLSPSTSSSSTGHFKIPSIPAVQPHT